MAHPPPREAVDAVVIGVGVNNRTGPNLETSRRDIRRLSDALREKYGRTPLLAVDTPANKFLGQEAVRNRLHSINAVLGDYFTPVHFNPTAVNTNNPHYTREERAELHGAIGRALAHHRR